MGKKKFKVNSNPRTDETKSEHFVRIAGPRVNKAVKAISQLGHCAGATYEYTPGQVNQIISVLMLAIDTVENQFLKKKATTSEFTFTE